MTKIDPPIVILSRKESLYEEPYTEKETFAFTTDFEEWFVDQRKRHDELIKLELYEHEHVTEASVWNDFVKKAAGYMLRPVVLVEGKTYAAVRYRVKNFSGLSARNFYIYDIYKDDDEYVLRAAQI